MSAHFTAPFHLHPMFLFVCVFLDVIFYSFLGLLLLYLMFLLLYLCVMCVCRISIKITYLLTYHGPSFPVLHFLVSHLPVT